MKKFLLIGFAALCFASCNTMHTDYKLSDMLNKNLLHSIFSKGADETADSLKTRSNNHFNFFLKEGIAKKFGL